MLKLEFEKHINENYPSYIGMLKELGEQLADILSWYNSNRMDLIKEFDFRPGTFGRILNPIIAATFIFDQVKKFITNRSWDSVFLQNYVPQIVEQKNYIGHFPSIHKAIQFNLFHSIFHNIETTAKIICDNIEVQDKNKHPLIRVNKLTNSYPSLFIEFILGVRHSIHNNGFYQPIGKQKKTIHYELDGKIIELNENKSIDIDTIDIIKVVKILIEYTDIMLKHDKIFTIPVIEDKSNF